LKKEGTQSAKLNKTGVSKGSGDKEKRKGAFNQTWWKSKYRGKRSGIGEQALKNNNLLKNDGGKLIQYV